MDDARDDSLSELEQLVAEGLELRNAARSSWLDVLARRSPERVVEVRERLALLEALGLGETGPPIPAPPALTEPLTIGPFRLHERVGVGGMGEVWRADDGTRTVALKLVRPELLWFADAPRRFEREARAVSGLDHPCIVRLLDFGDLDGLPWMALEWVDGASLDEVLGCLRGRVPAALARTDFGGALAALCRASSTHELPFEGDSYAAILALLLARVAEGLQHAHDRGVIHRDVKPSNILIGADGRVLLADFGLALPSEASRLTRSGAWLGSLPYASPEQVQGGHELTERADVYSLGATLYECLSLRTPFLGGSETQVRSRILRGSREGLRRLNPAAPRELELVCDKAMDLDPARRYATAQDLADDLRRAARRQPVRARRTPGWLRLVRWSRRHTRAAAAILSMVLALAATTAWAVRERLVADRVRRMADSELVDRLKRESLGLWPPAPERMDRIDAWLEVAEGLLARRRLHEEALDELRHQALPYDASQADLDRATARDVLVAMRLEVEGLGHLLEHASPGPALPLKPDTVARLLAGWSAMFERAPRDFLEDFRLRLAELREIVARSDQLGELDTDQLRQFERMRAEGGRALFEDRSYRFEREFDQWHHDELSDLVRRLRTFEGHVRTVRDLRARSARIAAAAPSTRDAWAEALPAIRASTRQFGVELDPLTTLLPLRSNPATGLWEFLLVGTGEAPLPDPVDGDPGRLRIEPTTGIVLVLVPGGSFRMGLASDPTNRLPAAGPAHEVRLAPFFISKYELTLAQARRLAVPAEESAGDGDGTRPARLAWDAARDLLRAYGMDLPTEAQWEYAALAGCEWTAPDPALAVPSRHFRAVGSAPPNAFGLYDCTGNVAEWCQDWYIQRGYSSLPSRPGDGLKQTVLTGPGRSVRGGSYSQPLDTHNPRFRGPGYQSAAATTGVRPVMSLPSDGSRPGSARGPAR